MRTLAASLIIGAFAVMAVTGLMMFFHVRIGNIGLAHKWLAWLLIIGVVLHVTVNRKSFVRYFRKPLSITVIAVLLLLGGSLMLAGNREHGHSPVAELLKSFEQAPLSTLAQVAQRSPQAVMGGLKAQGFKVDREQQTVAEIASVNGQRSMDVLTNILGEAHSAK